MSRKTRPRQHVNPLARHHVQPIEVPEWEKVYAHLDRPFWLDVGVAKGWFLLEMAQKFPEWNFLGLEIRRSLVEDALRRQRQAGLTNLYYLYANANVHMSTILASLPPNAVRMVTFLFPDPWPKKKHHKRRVIQPELVNVLSLYLPSGAQVYLATDVYDLFTYSVAHLDAHPAFQRQPTPPTNPFPVTSEREVACRRLGREVYRALYLRV